jgi:Serine carboxypeptidase
VPQLVLKLDAWIAETKAKTPEAWVPALKGFLVGNGYTNYKYDGVPAFAPMAYYHGLIDDELYDYLGAHCNLSFYDWNASSLLSAGCKETMNTFVSYTKYANPFDVFGKCLKTPAPALTPYESHKVT